MNDRDSKAHCLRLIRSAFVVEAFGGKCAADSYIFQRAILSLNEKGMSIDEIIEAARPYVEGVAGRTN
jgi:hypothetical protein